MLQLHMVAPCFVPTCSAAHAFALQASQHQQLCYSYNQWSLAAVQTCSAAHAFALQALQHQRLCYSNNRWPLALCRLAQQLMPLPCRHRNTSDSLLGRLTKGRLQRGESTGLARNVGLQPEALDDETEMEAMAKVWAHPEDLHLFPVRRRSAAAVFLVVDGLGV